MQKLKWLLKKLSKIIIVCVILIALFIILLRLLTPYLGHYQEDLESWLSSKYNVEIKFKKIEAIWHGYEPMFKIENVRIYDPEHERLVGEVDQLYLGIDLLHSIRDLRLQPGHLILSGAATSFIEDAEHNWHIQGLASSEPTAPVSVSAKEFLGWLLMQHKIVLNDIKANFYFYDGSKISMTDLDASLVSHFEQHKLTGQATFATKPLSQVQFALNLKGSLDELNDMRGKFSVRARQIPLDQWSKLVLGEQLSITSGKGEFEILGRLKKGKLATFRTRYKVADVNLQNTADEPDSFKINNAAGHIKWELSKASGWSLTGNQLQNTFNDHVWPEDQFSVREMSSKGVRRHKLAVFFKYANLQDLSQLLLLFNKIDPEKQELFKALNLSGVLNNFNMITQQHDQEIMGYSLGVDFRDVANKPWQKLPGLSGLSGHLQIEPGDSGKAFGEIKLNSDQVELDYPKLFAKPLDFSVNDSSVKWKSVDEELQIAVPQFAIDNSEGVASGQMSLVFPKQGSAKIELLAGAKLINYDNDVIRKYLPVGIMTKPLTEWLQAAVKDGKSLEATTVLRGSLDQFPFDNKQGTFSIQALVNDATLEYLPKWPRLDHINAEIDLNGRNLHAHLNQGEISGLHIKYLDADLAAIGKRTILNLKIDGVAKGDADHGMNYIHASPLEDIFGKDLQVLKAKGPMRLGLHLQIPLQAGKKPEVNARGSINLHNASIALPAWNINVDHLAGILNFTNKSIQAKKLQGKIFNQSMQFSLQSKNTKQKGFSLDLTGRGFLNIKTLSEYLKFPLTNYLAGEAPVRALLKFNKNTSNTLLINSDLFGISSTLPLPLDKTVNASVPSNILMKFAANKPTKIRMSYGNKVNAAVSITHENGKFAFMSGQMQLGTKRAEHQTLPGIAIKGDLKLLDLASWIEFIHSTSSNGNGTLGSYIQFSEVDLNVAKLNAFGFMFDNVKNHMLHDANSWQASVNGEDIQAKIIIPENLATDPITGNFAKLYLPQNSSTTKPTSNPGLLSQFPMLSVICDDCKFGDRKLGKLSLSTSRQPEGISIDQLVLETDTYNVQSHGLWSIVDGQEQTAFYGQLSSHDVAETLFQLDLPTNLHGKRAKMHFTLKWPGSPFAAELKTLSGNFSARINDGRIEGLAKDTAAKLNLGRMITLLSLHSLPKRLQLNFKDLTHTGLYFDLIKGDFRITAGNAYTNDINIDSTVAKIGLKGRVGLIAEDYDLTLTVIPNITSSLPLVATIAGGPIAGVVTWVVDKAVSPEVNKITRHIYTIMGPWDDPEVSSDKTSLLGFTN